MWRTSLRRSMGCPTAALRPFFCPPCIDCPKVGEQRLRKKKPQVSGLRELRRSPEGGACDFSCLVAENRRSGLDRPTKNPLYWGFCQIFHLGFRRRNNDFFGPRYWKQLRRKCVGRYRATGRCALRLESFPRVLTRLTRNADRRSTRHAVRLDQFVEVLLAVHGASVFSE